MIFEVVELTNPLEVIDLAPYTYESDYYIEQCIIENYQWLVIQTARFRGNTAHKPIDYYCGQIIQKHRVVFEEKTV